MVAQQRRKKAKPAEAEIVEETPPREDVREAAVAPRPRRVRIGRYFWGLLFILLGGLLLLQNLGVLDVHLADLWRLWPLLIIGIGLSVLSLRGWLAALVVTLFTLGALAAVAFVAVGNWSSSSPRTTDTATVQKQSAVKQANIDIDAGAGKLRLKTADSADIVQATLESNFANLRQTSTQDGDTQQVKLSLDNRERWWRGGFKNELHLSLSEQLPLRVRINAGASDIDADLEHAQLRAIDLQAGASSINLRLGDRMDNQDVTIDAGASSIRLQVPRDAGVRLRMEGGLSSKDLQDLREVSSGVFETDNFNTAQHKIFIVIKAGLSGVHLSRY
jgi:hypothetical protein